MPPRLDAIVMDDDNRPLCDFAQPSLAGIRNGIRMPAMEEHFEINPSLIRMLSEEPFRGATNEDPYAHIANFTDLCETFKINNMSSDDLKLRCFKFSLRDKARAWEQSMSNTDMDTWEKVVTKFLARFYPPAKTAAMRNEILNFKQHTNESIGEAWERFQDMIRKCPHNNIKLEMLVYTFYSGLYGSAKETVDSAAGGSFMQKTRREAHALLEQLAQNDVQWGRKDARTVASIQEDEAYNALKARIERLAQQNAMIQQALEERRQACEYCQGSHPSHHCPIRAEAEEINFIANQNRNFYGNNFNGGRGQAQDWRNQGMQPRQQQRKPLQEVMEEFMEFLVNFKKEMKEELNSHKKVAPKDAKPCLVAEEEQVAASKVQTNSNSNETFNESVEFCSYEDCFGDEEGEDAEYENLFPDLPRTWMTHKEDAWEDDEEDELNEDHKEGCNVISSRPGPSVVEYLSSHNFGKFNFLKAMGMDKEVKVPQKKKPELKMIDKTPQPTEVHSFSVNVEKSAKREEVSRDLAMITARRRLDFDEEERPKVVKEDLPEWRSRTFKPNSVDKEAYERRKRGRVKKAKPLNVADVRKRRGEDISEVLQATIDEIYSSGPQLGISYNFKLKKDKGTNPKKEPRKDPDKGKQAKGMDKVSNVRVQAWKKKEPDGKKEEGEPRRARNDFGKMVATLEELSLDKGDGVNKLEGPEINNKGSQEPP